MRWAVVVVVMKVQSRVAWSSKIDRAPTPAELELHLRRAAHNQDFDNADLSNQRNKNLKQD